MRESKSSRLFNSIAPFYGLFFGYQKRQYERIIESVKDEINILSFRTIIDIGCGTGALCSVLENGGLVVTGVDPAEKMLGIAKKKTENTEIKFLQENVVGGLPFEDNSFDIAISSYVAHGLESKERKLMYAEMSRIACEYVIIHDYNSERALLTSIVEWMEGGDYFHFIKHTDHEMRDCITEMKACFSEVRVINTGKRSNWYVCRPVVD